MKFSSYQRGVEPNVANPPAVQSPRDLNAFGTQGKEWDAFGGAVGQVNKVLTKQQDDADAADVMEARNRIMTSLTEKLYGDQGLFTTGKGENAKGLIDRTTDTLRETFDDISKDYNPRVRYALKGNLNENMANFQRIAASQEQSEKMNLAESNYKSSLQSNVNLAGANPRDARTIELAMGQNAQLIKARGQMMGWSGLEMAAQERAATDSTVGAAVDAAVAGDDYNTAGMLLERYKRMMNVDTYNRKLAAVFKKKETKKEFQSVDDIIKAHTKSDGSFDLAAAKQDVEKLYGRGARRWVNDGAAPGGTYSGDANLDSMINAAAAKYNLDPALLAGLVKQESGFSGQEISKAGAIGLTQLMPSTAQSLGVSNPYDDAQNLEGGARYLRQMLDAFGGDIDKALAAYNAGPEAVKQYGGIPPYAETQNYVKAVKGNYEGFKQSGGGPGNGFSLMSDTYYNVEPGKEGEVTGLNNNTWQKLQMFGYLWQKEFGEKPLVTAGYAPNGHSQGGGHPDGMAIDIVSDSLNNKDDWAKAEAIARKAGLEPYNEYDHSNWTQDTTGDNFHLHDKGGAADYKAVGGNSSGHWESAYDPEKMNRMDQLIDARYADWQRQKNIQLNETIDNVKNQIMNAGGRAAALEILQSNEAALGPNGYGPVKSYLDTKWPAPRIISGGGGSRGGGSYGGAGNRAINSAANSINKMAYVLEAGGSIGASSMYAYHNAGNILEDNGGLNEDDAATVSQYESDQGFQSDLTDDIEANGLVGAYNHLRQNGMSPTAAAIILSKVDPSYTSKDHQGDQESDEG